MLGGTELLLLTMALWTGLVMCLSCSGHGPDGTTGGAA